MPTRTLCVAALLLLAACGPPADVEWPVNGGVDNIRYSPLTEITKDNVGQLEVAWTYDSQDAFEGSEMQSNPIVVGGALYATTPTLKVIALDAATGALLWSFDPIAASDAPRGRARHRGVTVHEDRVFVAARSYLWALDRLTGEPIETFGEEGWVDLREGLGRPAEGLSVSASTPGQVFEDLLIMGSSVPETLPAAPGHIRAFDVNTGEQRWMFSTIPSPGEFGYDTWPEGAHEISGGANAWAGVTVDPSTAMVFAATGSASFDFYGSNRHGDNLFANSVLALDARTGERVWHFQAVHHDVWDWDFPAAPSLVTVMRDGSRVDAVAQISKTGYIYVFDRRTGDPLFEIEERPVPASTIPGELLSTTQPHPVLPPPFARQGLTEDMLTQRTPEAHAAVLEQFRRQKKGMYEPPSFEGTIVFPGFDGGGEWGGAAFDPDSGLLFVNSNEMPWTMQLIPNNDTSLYNMNCAACHGEDRKGAATFSSLENIGERFSREELTAVIRQGIGMMPGFPDMGGANTSDIVEFLITGVDSGMDPVVTNAPTWQAYRNAAYTIFLDPDGYPGTTPPWGTLNAIDLNSGEIRWQIPFGEFPELVEQGLTDTGSDNYGGPVVTASGLLFIGATNFDNKFRAYEALTGELLWETLLPAAGNATPSVYSIDGRQYIVIACGGGKNGAASGSSLVAFALPNGTAVEATDASAVADQDGASAADIDTPHRIVFQSERGAGMDVWVMNANGTDPTNLTNNGDRGFNDRHPTASADGTRIAFRSDRDGSPDVFAMEVDGSNPINLTSTAATDIDPSFSPDGSRIVFDSDRDGDVEIWVMNSDGSSLSRLTDNDDLDNHPFWSPNGEDIAFYSNRDNPDNPDSEAMEIYLMAANGSNVRRLTDHPADDRYPSWSPDGSRITFSSDRDGNAEIYVMNTDGSNLVRLTTNDAADLAPVWSPDGDWIVFVSERHGTNEIYVIGVDGTSETRLTTNDVADSNPRWLPVGGIDR